MKFKVFGSYELYLLICHKTGRDLLNQILTRLWLAIRQCESAFPVFKSMKSITIKSQMTVNSPSHCILKFKHSVLALLTSSTLYMCTCYPALYSRHLGGCNSKDYHQYLVAAHPAIPTAVQRHCRVRRSSRSASSHRCSWTVWWPGWGPPGRLCCADSIRYDSSEKFWPDTTLYTIYIGIEHPVLKASKLNQHLRKDRALGKKRTHCKSFI